MSEWAAAVHRGQCHLDVVTRLRVREDGGEGDLPADRHFLCCVVPDDLDPFLIAFERIENVARWVREMSPREVVLHVGRGEDAKAIFEALAELTLSSTPVQ